MNGALSGESGLDATTPGILKLHLTPEAGDPGFTGKDALLLAIRFKAKAASGTTAIGFVKSAGVISNGTLFTVQGSNATITLTSSSTPPPSNPGSLYVSPQAVSAKNGTLVTLQIRSDATLGNAAQIDVTYPSNTLEYVSHNTTGSVFPNEIGSSNNPGTFSTNLYANPGSAGIAGESLLLTIVLRAKSDTGTATVGLAADSKVVMGSAITANVSTGSVITFLPLQTNPDQPVVTPPPTTPPPSTPPSYTPPPQNTPQQTSNTNTDYSEETDQVAEDSPETSTTEGSDISGGSFTVSEIVITATQVSWKTDTPTTGIVKYGPAHDKLYYTAASGQSATEHSVKIDSSKLILGSSTYFVIASTDGTGNTAQGSPETLVVPPVRFVVRDVDGNIVGNAEVEINGTIFKSDENGVVEIVGIQPGDVAMTIRKGGKILATMDMTLIAGVSDTADLKLPVAAKRSISTTMIATVVVVAVAMLSLIGGGIYMVKRPRRVVTESAGDVFSAHVTSPIQPETVISPTQPQTETDQNNKDIT